MVKEDCSVLQIKLVSAKGSYLILYSIALN